MYLCNVKRGKATPYDSGHNKTYKTMKTDYHVKMMKNIMKEMNETLKGINENYEILESALNNYTYENALGRNREATHDLLRQINQMAEYAATIYNHNKHWYHRTMKAQATYTLEKD